MNWPDQWVGQTSYWHCTNIVNNQTRDSYTRFFLLAKIFGVIFILSRLSTCPIQVQSSHVIIFPLKGLIVTSIEVDQTWLSWFCFQRSSYTLIKTRVWQFELKILGCAQSFWYSWSILKTRKLFLPIILFLRHFASWRSLACLECHRKIAKNELSSDRDWMIMMKETIYEDKDCDGDASDGDDVPIISEAIPGFLQFSPI